MRVPLGQAPVFNGDVGFNFGPVQEMPPLHQCSACDELHAMGWCRLKVAGLEYCGLCGLAHLGFGRTCPQLNDEAHVTMILDTLKESTESKDLIEHASRYLRLIRGQLIQDRRTRERLEYEALRKRLNLPISGRGNRPGPMNQGQGALPTQQGNNVPNGR